MPSSPKVSFIIATHNRRDVLLSTLQHLRDTANEAGPAEIIVVDNASRDSTASAVRSAFPETRLITLTENLGSCAKAAGVDHACGEHVVFLDDDSYPRPGSIRRMVEIFRNRPRLGAAGFLIHLPDGRNESSALPNVYVGCGAGFRADALRDVGGLDPALFMQAEEYDLSFRLVAAGWQVETFSDLHVDHLKTPQARVSRRTVYYDTRNNLIVAARYLPEQHQSALTRDWSQRYRWIASAAGCPSAYWRGRIEASLRRGRERRTHAKWRLSPTAFEYLFRFDLIGRNISTIARTGVRTLLLAGMGKNIRPFVDAARAAGLHIPCIADDRFARSGRSYHGIPIRPVAEAFAIPPQAIVISNTSPAHAPACAHQLAALTTVPIHRWFGFDKPSS